MALGTADLLNRFFFLRYKKATGGTLMFIEKGHKQGKALLMFALQNVFLTAS